jgi:hypothetical protein
VFQPAAAIAALVMRERAAAMIETHVLETQYDGSRVVVPSNLAKEDQHHRSLANAIRALPTTFTDAELLAAAMQLPEVRALIDAAREQSEYLSLCGEDGDLLRNTLAALAPLTKGGE